MPKNMLFLYEIMAVFVHAKKLVAPKLTPAIRKISSPEMCYLAFFFPEVVRTSYLYAMFNRITL